MLFWPVSVVRASSMTCFGCGMPSLACRSVYDSARPVAGWSVPVGPVNVPACWHWRSRRSGARWCRLDLGDPDQEESEPAQDDVGAGTFLDHVVRRAAGR